MLRLGWGGHLPHDEFTCYLEAGQCGALRRRWLIVLPHLSSSSIAGWLCHLFFKPGHLEHKRRQVRLKQGEDLDKRSLLSLLIPFSLHLGMPYPSHYRWETDPEKDASVTLTLNFQKPSWLSQQHGPQANSTKREEKPRGGSIHL